MHYYVVKHLCHNMPVIPTFLSHSVLIPVFKTNLAIRNWTRLNKMQISVTCGRQSWLGLGLGLTASFRAHANIISLLTYLLT